MPRPRKCDLLLYSWGKIAKVGELLNLVVVFEARSIKTDVTPLRAAEAAYPRKAREYKCSHTDSISPSLYCRGSKCMNKSLL